MRVSLTSGLGFGVCFLGLLLKKGIWVSSLLLKNKYMFNWWYKSYKPSDHHKLRTSFSPSLPHQFMPTLIDWTRFGQWGILRAACWWNYLEYWKGILIFYDIIYVGYKGCLIISNDSACCRLLLLSRIKLYILHSFCGVSKSRALLTVEIRWRDCGSLLLWSKSWRVWVVDGCIFLVETFMVVYWSINIFNDSKRHSIETTLLNNMFAHLPKS
jgi:hypothetical protein